MSYTRSSAVSWMRGLRDELLHGSLQRSGMGGHHRQDDPPAERIPPRVPFRRASTANRVAVAEMYRKSLIGGECSLQFCSSQVLTLTTDKSANPQIGVAQ